MTKPAEERKQRRVVVGFSIGPAAGGDNKKNICRLWTQTSATCGVGIAQESPKLGN
jgi:hypothetical protein